MAAYYKSQGKTLLEVMADIYAEFGYYCNTVKSYEFDGAAGMKKMQQIMDNLRKNPPKDLAGAEITYTADYETSVEKDIESGTESKTDLPKSNVLAYKAKGGSGLIVRPSGTEPKIKAYITAIGTDKASAEEKADKLIAEANSIMNTEA